MGWRYQEVIDPLQIALGIGPLEGSAEAVVRDGRIAVLTLVVSPEAWRRLQGETGAAVVRAAATRRAAPPGTRPSAPPREPRDTAAESTGAAWPLALGGLALLGACTVAWRRRQHP